MSILKKAPEGAAVLDIAAAVAARAEARAAAGDVGRFIKLTVGYVEVRPEVALAAAIDLQSEKLREGLGALLVDPSDVDALVNELTSEDLAALTKFITGATPGE